MSAPGSKKREAKAEALPKPGAPSAKERRSTPRSAVRREASPATRKVWRALLLPLWIVVALIVGFAYPVLARGNSLLAANWQWWWALPLLVVVPVVIWRATYGEDRRVPRIQLGTVQPLTSGPRGIRVWLRDLPGALRGVALMLFVFALARPIATIKPQNNDEQGIDLVVVLDLSGSMRAAMDQLPPELMKYVPERAPGVRPTRLDAAKAVIRDFISRRKTDRIGVVVFGRDAYVLSPPTLDYHLLDTLVSKMNLELIDNAATAIGDATGVAVARLRRSNAKSKAIILLTDGDNNAGKISPEYAAHLATVVGAKVYTIQIGDGETAEVQDRFNLFGQPHYVKVNYPTNPELLKQIAKETGGQMFVATDASALQASFHKVLDELEKTRFEASIASFEELYRFFLLPAVLLVALEALLHALVLRRFP
ncbi:MAG: VWA domain-containing protein [Polyangiaceae bacterium]